LRCRRCVSRPFQHQRDLLLTFISMAKKAEVFLTGHYHFLAVLPVLQVTEYDDVRQLSR